MGVPENLYTADSIRTFTGRYFDIMNLDPEMVHIEDIAHALSMQPRFAGHLPVFYSVAQHCIHVAELVHPALRLEGLLHDASEAYLLDIPKPFKKHLPDYQALEKRVELVIVQALGLRYPWHPMIKEADKKQLEFEWQALVIEGGNKWFPMSQTEAKERFLSMYLKLKTDGRPTE